MTFDEASAAGNGQTTGFDYLRIGLSLAVLMIHCTQIAEGDLIKTLWSSNVGPLMSIILPAFFALSGYLVTGSLFRNSIPHFMTLRVLRIFPALTVEIVLTALIVGPLFTVLPLRDYFTHSEFYQYFLNALGIIHYSLPGVFGGQPPNMQLWTVPFELECYIVLVVLAMFRIPRKPKLFLLVTMALLVGTTAASIYSNSYQGGWNVPGRVLVLCFLFGCLMYVFRKTIPASLALAVACLIVAYLALLFPRFAPLSAPAVAYATIYIGLLRLPPIPLGDLSYGVFLFHSPVARSIDEISGHEMPLALLIVLTTGITGVFALLSWRLIERPVLRSKHRALKAVSAFLDPVTRFTAPLTSAATSLLPFRRS